MSRNRHSHDKPDSVYSPLHRLQADLARNKQLFVGFARSQPIDGALNRMHRRESQNYDNESIYSFDSVSTSGRLLDRLDLDSEDSDYESSLRRRESGALIQRTGRAWDVFSDDLAHALNTNVKLMPRRAKSALGLDRMRSAKSYGLARSLSQNNTLPIQTVAGNLTLPKQNGSFDSLHASRQSSFTSVSSAAESTSATRQNPPSRLGNLRSFAKHYPEHSPIPESMLSSPTSAKFPSTSVATQMRSDEAHSQPPTPSKRCVSSSSNESSTSLEASPAFILNTLAMFDPLVEATTRKALSMRAEGNHREASYQLQTLANAPHSYPKAMYLYAKALMIGQGVKLSEAQSIKWLCRCFLTTYIAHKSAPESHAFTTYVAKLASLLPEELLEMVKVNIAGENHDPFTLMDTFQTLSASAVNKITQLNFGDKNFVGGAYFLLGECLLKGLGVPLKDEVTGRAFLAKAASFAYVDAMTKLGELWCGKTKHFKKNIHIASAWLRLGEFFGKQDLGNSWIYKSKYLDQRKK